MNSHVQFQFVLQQINTFLVIHGHSWWCEKQSGHSVYKHFTPNHDTWGVFHCLHGVPFIKLLFGGSINIALARSELLYCRFIRKKHLLPLLNCLFSMLFSKPQTLNFHGPCQPGFLCRFMSFQIKIDDQMLTYSSPTNVHTFCKQYGPYLACGTQWRPNCCPPNDVNIPWHAFS